jgi:hypothetical protein
MWRWGSHLFPSRSSLVPADSRGVEEVQDYTVRVAERKSERTGSKDDSRNSILDTRSLVQRSLNRLLPLLAERVCVGHVDISYGGGGGRRGRGREASCRKWRERGKGACEVVFAVARRCGVFRWGVVSCSCKGDEVSRSHIGTRTTTRQFSTGSSRSDGSWVFQSSQCTVTRYWEVLVTCHDAR